MTVKFIATQQPDGTWFLYTPDYGNKDNREFRGRTLDECLYQMFSLDGESIVIGIGYLKRTSLESKAANAA